MYVLVKTQKGNNCAPPKGHVEGSETEKETALREIYEETCVQAEIIDGFRKTIEYKLPKGTMKQVVYFIARYDNQEAKTNPDENVDVLLLPLEDALTTVPYENVREVLQEADKFINQTECANAHS